MPVFDDLLIAIGKNVNVQTVFYKHKKGGEVSTFFAPNLTMNLTYLCYGESKIDERTSIATKNTLNSVNYRRTTRICAFHRLFYEYARSFLPS